MKITLYIDFDEKKVYKSKEEFRRELENDADFLENFDFPTIEEWLEDNYTIVDVWKGDREQFIKDYNEYVTKTFNMWFNDRVDDLIQEVTIEV